MYFVCEIGPKGEKPCTAEAFGWKKGEGWDENEFPTFEEAENYARRWLGDDYYPGSGILQVDEPYEYSGYLDWIVIRRR